MIDTVPVKKTVAREPRSTGSPGGVQARCLVAEYLRDWGLRDPDVIAAESRRIVELAEIQAEEAHGTVTPRNLCSTAIQLTMEEVEAVISEMAASSTRNQVSGVPVSHAVLPQVARVLLEFPEAVQHRDRPPARLLHVLERSVAPVIPRPHHREMPVQPSTRLCSLFRGGYWMDICGRLQAWVCRRVGVS